MIQDYVPSKNGSKRRGNIRYGNVIKEAVIDKYSNGDEEEIGANFTDQLQVINQKYME